MPVMRLVERHVIKRADLRYIAIDVAAFAAKNLYNAATYEVRQVYLTHGITLSYSEIYERMKTHEAYRALPAKVAQWVLQGVAQNWQSFRAARDAWTEDPSQFLGRPICRATRTNNVDGISSSTPYRRSVHQHCVRA